jgi:hypothetical protein
VAEPNLFGCRVNSSSDFNWSEAIQQQMESCIAETKLAYVNYTEARKKFNDTWLPILFIAIMKGDEVAEVIMRQCETTHVLDRNELESSCDSSSARCAKAKERLQEIGFIPAIDISDELINSRGNSIKL